MNSNELGSGFQRVALHLLVAGMNLWALLPGLTGCGERPSDVGQGAGQSIDDATPVEDGQIPSQPQQADAATSSLCDGSPQLKLALVQTNCCGPVDSFLDTQLGADYLYVTGDCRYWARHFVPNPAGHQHALVRFRKTK